MNRQFGYDMAERFARFHRISWKQALNLVAGAPTRLHHYRDVRTQMMRDALCNLECEHSERGGDCA